MPLSFKHEKNIKALAFAIVAALVCGIGFCIFTSAPVYRGIFFALVFAIFVVFYIGGTPKEALSMLLSKVPNIKNVMVLLILIGAVVGLWMRSGVLATFVAYGLTYLSEMNMVLCAFLMCSLTSVIIGSAFGAMSTVGIVFVGIAKALAIPMPLMAGAIISGCYLGDRTAPLSPMYNLIAAMTGTDMPGNLKYMSKYTALGVGLTAVFCLFAGSSYTGGGEETIAGIVSMLEGTFKISIIQLLPLVLLILLIVVFKCTIIRSMLITLGATVAMAVLYSRVPLLDGLSAMLLGYHPQNAELAGIISGSGITSMLTIVITVLLSTMLNGILDATGMINILLDSFNKPARTERGLMINAAVTSDVLSIVTCNQSLCIMATGIYFSPKFDEMRVTRRSLAHIISDNGIIISPLIPWNINAIMAASVTGVTCIEFFPYATLCLLLPVFTIYNMWRAGTPSAHVGLPAHLHLGRLLRRKKDGK